MNEKGWWLYNGDNQLCCVLEHVLKIMFTMMITFDDYAWLLYFCQLMTIFSYRKNSGSDHHHCLEKGAKDQLENYYLMGKN